MEKPDYYRIGVLHQKCKKISHGHINDIQHCPEFVSALLSSEEDYTDESVCEIITQTALSLPREYVGRRKLFKTARGVNLDVYGEIPDSMVQALTVYPGFEDLEYLGDVLGPLSWYSKDFLLNNLPFLRAARKLGNIKTIEDAYLAFENAFFEMTRAGEKSAKSPKIRARYVAMRDIAGEFCQIVFGNSDEWISRFREKYRPEDQ